MKARLIALVLVIASLGWCGDSASAAEDLQLLLSQAAYGECGTRKPDCHAATWHMAANWSEVRRKALGQTIRDYFAAWRVQRLRARIVRSLRADGAHPAVWWPHGRWENHRAAWLSMYERAGAFLAGGVGNPCNGKPMHTGGGGVDHPCRRWVRLDCGDTGDQFFCGEP